MDQDAAAELCQLYVRGTVFLHCTCSADPSVSGKRASPDQYTRVLYLVSRFNPVLEISEIEVYHIG